MVWYNEEHKHSALKFVTPGQRHQGEDIALLAQRVRILPSPEISTSRPIEKQHSQLGSSTNHDPQSAKAMREIVSGCISRESKQRHLSVRLRDMVTTDPSWKRTQGCIAHHVVMLDLECAGVKVHAAPCSCAELPATVCLHHLFRATILTDTKTEFLNKEKGT